MIAKYFLRELRSKTHFTQDSLSEYTSSFPVKPSTFRMWLRQGIWKRVSNFSTRIGKWLGDGLLTSVDEAGSEKGNGSFYETSGWERNGEEVIGPALFPLYVHFHI